MGNRPPLPKGDEAGASVWYSLNHMNLGWTVSRGHLILVDANFDNSKARRRVPNSLEVPQISVLVTVFNRERYLRAALESILDSTYTDFEVIVVDDCSSDNSLEIARQVAATDSRVRVFANSWNLGDYGNRMHAASLARGTFLKYLDSDDLIYRHSLQVMIDGMTSFPDSALGLSHSLPEDREPYPWKLEPEACYRKHFLERGCLGCGPSGAIIRRDYFKKSGGFHEKWGVLADIDLWLRMAANNPIVLLPPGLVWWRRHDGQEISKEGADEVYLRRGYELDMKALSGNCPLPERFRQKAIIRKKQHFARRVLSLAIRKKKLKQAIRLYQESKLSVIELLAGFSRYQ